MEPRTVAQYPDLFKQNLFMLPEVNNIRILQQKISKTTEEYV